MTARAQGLVRVPDGFAAASSAYQGFLGDTGLARPAEHLRGLGTDEVRALSAGGNKIRQAIVD